MYPKETTHFPKQARTDMLRGIDCINTKNDEEKPNALVTETLLQTEIIIYI